MDVGRFLLLSALAGRQPEGGDGSSSDGFRDLAELWLHLQAAGDHPPAASHTEMGGSWGK